MHAKNAKASRTQIIAIHKLLEEHLEIIGERLVRYRGEHSDVSIAALVDAAPNSIASVRRELFGDLVRSSGRSAETANTVLLQRLEGEITNLNSRYLQTLNALNELIVKHNRLCQHLTINRVVDANHLTILTEKPTQTATGSGTGLLNAKGR